ncbi:MAG: tRNA (adenosine(37)-N6)-dimethylallyltransferase MiaA [Acidimicrobiales bacterium]
MGATATGKSAFAFELAVRTVAEIVSADSMAVYRGMDIGTASPGPDERTRIRHHCVDVADPSQDYTVAHYQADARAALAAVDEAGAGAGAILVGGTGLYVRSVVDDLEIPGIYPQIRDELGDDPDTAALHRRLTELDPVAAARMEPSNRRRIVRALEVTLGAGRPFSSFGPGLDTHGATRFRLIGIARSREEIDERIARRYEAQMDAGFLDEVKTLAARPEGLSRTARQALGYRELLAHLAGEMTLAAALEEAVRRTRRFARRQERWFRRDPRITWLDATGRNPQSLVDDLMGDSTPCR